MNSIWYMVMTVVGAILAVVAVPTAVAMFWVFKGFCHHRSRMDRMLDEFDEEHERIRADIERGGRPDGPRFKL